MKNTVIIYEVHSDCDENNLYQEFEGKGSMQKALAYAKRNKEEGTWVERICWDTFHGDLLERGCIWNYADEA